MLLDLLAVFNLGEMDRCLLVTVIAFQWRFSPRLCLKTNALAINGISALSDRQ
jgi:hypothetical protein